MGAAGGNTYSESQEAKAEQDSCVANKREDPHVSRGEVKSIDYGS